MSDIYSRTESLLGADAMEKLKKSKMALFGLGGVGSATFEALVRSGIGTIAVIDKDEFSPSNLNRQLLATSPWLGRRKCEAAVARGQEINPDVKIIPYNMFYLPDTADKIDLSEYDVVIDAVDTVTAKLEIIGRAKTAGCYVISCMGTGNKTDISRLKFSDISKTTECPLARTMRKELRRRGIEALDVVWSDEKPEAAHFTGELKGDRPAPASAIFVPAAAGLILAEKAVKHIIGASLV